MNKKEKIRKKILKEIINFYEEEKGKKFVPGKTYIPYAGRVYDAGEIMNLVDASLDFWLTAGKYTKAFERGLADFVGKKCSILTNSGSSANLLAVSALKSPLLGKARLKAKDEIITAASCFPTTVNPIVQNGLTPVFIDVELGTYNVIPEMIEKAISRRTRAIFTAHTLGNPARIKEIRRISQKYNLWFIEDNSDSLGSLYGGRYTGSFGHISSCSFYPAHLITMGEGGAVLTDDAVLKKAILSLRDWGRECWCMTGRDNTCGRRFSMKRGELPFGYDHKYVYSHIGYNLKATDMQAACGLAQLAKIERFIKARKENFTFFYKHFKMYEEYFVLPRSENEADPCWFGFPLLVRSSAPFSRNDIVRYLEKNKIATRMLFGGNIIRQPAYKDAAYRVCGSLRNTDLVMRNLFWIGVYPGIKSGEREYIRGVIGEFIRSRA
ncbi:MAG: lipopolysaccharide biosynthesis protein RfbH [Candidatus Omnitrophica bacterium]|nr:lipopolysaccharide biosynthesis protein RfbH [Candidatus Omnitrophota bacterium]